MVVVAGFIALVVLLCLLFGGDHSGANNLAGNDMSGNNRGGNRRDDLAKAISGPPPGFDPDKPLSDEDRFWLKWHDQFVDMIK
jgi:hypothetical protein